MAEQSILAQVENGVARVTLNRPDVLNSFNLDMARAFLAALHEAAANDDVRAVHITGAGRGFCAGQDLAEVLPKDGGPMPDIGDVVHTCYNPIIRAIRALEKPVICAVNGVAAGAGANLAFACDITIAAEEANFVESFGTQRATGLFFLGDKLPAAKAKEWGLIWDCVPLASLQETTMALAASLATQATRGFGLTKRALNHSLGATLDAQLDFEEEMMREAGKTADYAEGVRAFLEKRRPEYTGR
jgi:2-(1,2-epoxy-1,2-dihydrophenyl)acetyl-CoA isomerase